MIVTPRDRRVGSDEFITYLVTSETVQGDSHIVDMEERTCSCPWWSDKNNHHGWCKHMDAVVMYRTKATPQPFTMKGLLRCTAKDTMRFCPCGAVIKKESNGKGSIVTRSTCRGCRSKIQDSKAPLRRVYRNIKISARRRGKTFSLTYEKLESLALAAGYKLGTNKHAQGLSIDRIKSGIGYTDDNVRIMTLSDNVRREYIEEWDPPETRPDKVAPPPLEIKVIVHEDGSRTEIPF